MRSGFILALVLAVGCGPATAVLVDGDALDDTDVSGDDLPDRGTDDPVDGTDVDPDTIDPDTDTDAPIAYFWEGQRDFTFDQGGFGICDDTLIETGEDVTDDPNFADARAACPSCAVILLVEMDKDFLCPQQGFQGYAVATPTLRGVGARPGGGTRIFGARLEEPTEWFEFEDVNGGWSTFSYAYEATTRAGGLEVPFSVEGSGAIQ